jgi:hypothetical protein
LGETWQNSPKKVLHFKGEIAQLSLSDPCHNLFGC